MSIIHSLSDHATLLLSTEGPIRKIKYSFKLKNWWLKEQDFQAHAKTAWSFTANKSF